MAMDVGSLEALQNLNQPAYEQRVTEKSGEKAGSSFRLDALREAAVGVGARGGLVNQTKVVNRALDRIARNLDAIYDFTPLMIKGRVIPPVLTITKDVYTQGDATNLRLAGRSYKIEAQPRFSSRPPQWREYIYIDYGEAKLPSATLLPRSPEEQEVWRKAVNEGWQQGVEQANLIFNTNVNRLNRDYVGMVRYHVLAMKRMVTLPVVAEQNMPLNTSGNSMSVDETLLRITALPEFNADMRDWSPLMNEEDVIQKPGVTMAPASPKLPADWPGKISLPPLPQATSWDGGGS